ncbi:hypothetical protein RZS08_03470, partial [Arthrospira platensis SPKY1]|nr:hypothetical protein [Arthrospira platensis SPKY1]
ARRAAQQADFILFVVDAIDSDTSDDRVLAAELGQMDAPIVLVRNKIDLLKAPASEEPVIEGAPHFEAVYNVSAATGVGLQELETGLGALFLGSACVEADAPML